MNTDGSVMETAKKAVYVVAWEFGYWPDLSGGGGFEWSPDIIVHEQKKAEVISDWSGGVEGGVVTIYDALIEVDTTLGGDELTEHLGSILDEKILTETNAVSTVGASLATIKQKIGGIEPCR